VSFLRHRKNHLVVIVDGQGVLFLDHSLLDRLSGGKARSAAVDTTFRESLHTSELRLYCTKQQELKSRKGKEDGAAQSN
jgi:hypothetical protein